MREPSLGAGQAVEAGFRTREHRANTDGPRDGGVFARIAGCAGGEAAALIVHRLWTTGVASAAVSGRPREARGDVFVAIATTGSGRALDRTTVNSECKNPCSRRKKWPPGSGSRPGLSVACAAAASSPGCRSRSAW